MFTVVPSWGWTIFVVAMIVIVAVGITAGIVSLFSRTEKKDGLR